MTLTSSGGPGLLPENFVDTIFHRRSGERKTPSWSLLSKSHIWSSVPPPGRVEFTFPSLDGQVRTVIDSGKYFGSQYNEGLSF